MPWWEKNIELSHISVSNIEFLGEYVTYFKNNDANVISRNIFLRFPLPKWQCFGIELQNKLASD